MSRRVSPQVTCRTCALLPCLCTRCELWMSESIDWHRLTHSGTDSLVPRDMRLSWVPEVAKIHTHCAWVGSLLLCIQFSSGTERIWSWRGQYWGYEASTELTGNQTKYICVSNTFTTSDERGDLMYSSNSCSDLNSSCMEALIADRHKIPPNRFVFQFNLRVFISKE